MSVFSLNLYCTVLYCSFKGRLDKHWKEFMFSLELPKRTVTSCYWRTDRQKAIWPIKPQKMVNGMVNKAF